jgi:hypothetical protein
MVQGSDVIHLELSIRKPPQSVRAWWTDLPDDYNAKDPQEQPHRIITTRRLPNGRELETHWRLPDGTAFQLKEILTLKPDGSWTFEVPSAMGFQILDEFKTEPASNGTKLTIHSTLTPQDPAAAGRMAMQKQLMTEGWKKAAEICERDAP